MSNIPVRSSAAVKERYRAGDTSAWQRSLRTSAHVPNVASKAALSKPAPESHQRVTSAFLWALQAEAKALRRQLDDTTSDKDARIKELSRQLAKSKAESEANRKAAEAAIEREAKASTKVKSLQAELASLRRAGAAGSQGDAAALRAALSAAGQQLESLRASEAAALAAQREAEAQAGASEDMVGVLSRTVLDFESEVAVLRSELAAERARGTQQANEIIALETALGLECFANFLRAAAMAAELKSAWQELAASQAACCAAKPPLEQCEQRAAAAAQQGTVKQALEAAHVPEAEATLAPHTPQRLPRVQQEPQPEEEPRLPVLSECDRVAPRQRPGPPPASVIGASAMGGTSAPTDTAPGDWQLPWGSPPASGSLLRALASPCGCSGGGVSSDGGSRASSEQSLLDL